MPFLQDDTFGKKNPFGIPEAEGLFHQKTSDLHDVTLAAEHFV